MDEDNRQPAGLSANAKRAAVQRVMRGETPSQVANSLGVPVHELMSWVRKYEQARQDAPEDPDEEHLAAVRDKPLGHTGLSASMAEIDYPELLEGVDKHYYESLTEEEQRELVIRQAITQEKVGYEKHAPKFFLPEEEDPYPEGRHVEQVDMFVARELNRPLLTLGGFLLGLAVCLAAAKVGMDFSAASWWTIGIAGAAAAVLVLIGGR